MKRTLWLTAFVIFCTQALSQQISIDFNVIERSNRVVVSWNNPFEGVIQLNVQRSYDSLKYYRTIYSATSPNLPQNGFSEPKQPNTRTYYRIFYVLEGGAYFFTPAKQAEHDLSSRSINLNRSNIIPGRIVRITNRGAVVVELEGGQFFNFRDSILRQTKDTMFAINDSVVELRPFVMKEVWRASNYIFTNREGYLNIALSDAHEKKYRIKFFEDNGALLFEINHLREPKLTLDKANFIHAGWFRFELYENEKLKEKNKFYLPKDF